MLQWRRHILAGFALLAFLGGQAAYSAKRVVEESVAELTSGGEACEVAFEGGRQGRARLPYGTQISVPGVSETFMVQEFLGSGGSRDVFRMESVEDPEREFIVSVLAPQYREQLATKSEDQEVLLGGVRHFFELEQRFLLEPEFREHWSPYVRMELMPIDLQRGRSGEESALVFSGMVGELGQTARGLFTPGEILEQYEDDELTLRLILAEQLSQAARWMAQNGLDHLDIKLGNVMVLGLPQIVEHIDVNDFLDGESIFVLADHGLLREQGRRFDGRRVFGTPLTIGPEQMRGAPIGMAGMAFSIGMTLLQTFWTTEEIRNVIGRRPAIAGGAVRALREAVTEYFAAEMEASQGARRVALRELRHFILSRITLLPEERELFPRWLEGGSAQARHAWALQGLGERRSRMAPFMPRELPRVYRP